MEKQALKTQLLEKIKVLDELVDLLSGEQHLSSEQAKWSREQIQELLKAVSVYEYIVCKREISEDIDLHLKIIESVNEKNSPQEDANKIPAAVLQVSTTEEVVEEATEKDQIREEIINSELEPSFNPEISEQAMKNNNRKIEIGINDRYRMLNELFSQNQNEFNMVLSELNSVETLAQAELYLLKLKELYGWKPDSPLVGLLSNLVKKRFVG